MCRDIFEFWSEAAPSDKVHPKDRYVLDRVKHGFDLRCLPACFAGPLKTAPVVLLYLSPGLNMKDIEEADTPEGQARHAERRKGYQPLRGPDDHEPAWRWWSGRTKAFGPWEQLQHRVAILNISAYHSRTFDDQHILSALPSCRVTLDWAQEVLFRQAENGERVVVCMRSAPFWGLGKRGRYGHSLFAPAAGRGGYMLKQGEDSVVRAEVVAAVQAALRPF
jgi:hypothetical protein